MDMSNFRPESHVAQRSRRDKLRVNQNSNTHLGDYSSNLDQLSVHQGLNSDLDHVGSFRFSNPSHEGSIFSSEMLNFGVNSQNFAESATARLDRPLMAQNALGTKVGGDPQNCSNWKSVVGSQQSCDWIVNYSSGLAGNESNQNHPMFVGEGGLSGDLKPNNMKPSYSGYQDLQANVTNNQSSEISSHGSQQHQQQHYEDHMHHFNSPPIYQNTLQEVVTSAATVTKGLKMTTIWGNHMNSLYDDNSYARISSHQWSTGGGSMAVACESTQGLSLSLSPIPPAKTPIDVFNNLPNSRNFKSSGVYVNSEPSIGTRLFANNREDGVGSTSAFAHRNTGPLGPFTGYATILKNSKFLKPAQQLMDEFVSVKVPNHAKTCETSSKISNRVCSYSLNAVESVDGAKGVDSATTSSSTFRSSNEISGEGGIGSSSVETFRPEYQHQKAKLLYMHEEVCRRYKQYHQQIQMVVSSFESVAGLSAATPYISLALKTVSRHFRCLKNVISDQLSHIRKVLGEDLSSPTTGTSSCKGDTSTSMLNFVDQGFQKQKSCSRGSDGFLESQHHVWRPQRGLPERAVAVLRAWLFDHFLHPYPTDTDKHMLASQTGLSRNQVSNWFINARVRVWKPMVEEIHLLETKSQPETNSGKPFSEGGPSQRVWKPMGEGSHEQWNQEKRSRTEQCEIAATSMNMNMNMNMDMDGGGTLSRPVPYQRSGFEMGALGAVSLTLGLRQSAEGAQQQQQEQRLRQQQHFGGQGQMMIHDFVG